MELMRVVAWCAIALTLLTNTAVNAATLSSIKGDILVNRGNGYQLQIGATELKPGDLVVANSGAGALIFYPDGCEVPVQPGDIVAVKDASPCATTDAGSNNTGLTPNALMTGAAIVGGGFGVIQLLKDNKKDKPASP